MNGHIVDGLRPSEGNCGQRVISVVDVSTPDTATLQVPLAAPWCYVVAPYTTK